MRNKKGLTMIELLLTVFLLTLFIPIIYGVFVKGLDSYNTSNNYTLQQQRLNEVIQLIKKDIEAADIVHLENAKSLWLTLSSGEKRYWQFDSTTQSLQFSKDNMAGSYSTQVEGLDISTSKFQISQGRLILTVKTESLNHGRYKGKNMDNPVITAFSIRYK